MNKTKDFLNEQQPCHEVQLKYKRQLFDTMPVLTTVVEVQKHLREFIDVDRIDLVEFFWVLYLTNSNRLIAMAEIGVGTTNMVGVCLKSIFQKALLLNATGIIVAHNHPSGSLKPSEADKDMTDKIKQAGKLFGITLIDHFIITSEGFYSFSEENLL